jgi:hypothetical protein
MSDRVIQNQGKKSISLKELLIRGLALLLVFFILALYLYLIQGAYEHAPEKTFVRAAYFAATIFGAGLIWDVSKHVAQLEYSNLTGFLHSLWKSAGYLICYAVFFIITYALTNIWAGPQSFLIPFTALAAAGFCILGIREGGRSIEHATTEPTKEPDLTHQ